ncbi:helix-turn-helix domain-containing protein, partial [Micromonospora aurantiaca]
VTAAAVDVAAPPPDRLTEAEARELTAEIRARVTDLLPLIKTAFQRRADLALGYPSWAAYCDAELRGLRMPLEERQAATAALHAEGMSTRAIAGALGTSDATVRRDLRDAGATDDAPERVVGLDGKRYASTRPMTAAEAGDLASADAGGEGLSSSSPVDTSAAPAAPVGAGAAGVSPQVDTAAVGSHDPAPADEVDSAAGETRPSTGAASALSPADPAGEGATPDPYITDPAQRAAWVADNAPGYVRVIDGEATETAVDPHDPGPVPEPPALAPGLADLIAAHLDDLTLSTDALAGQLLAAGPHAGNYLRRLRDHRHQVDQLIRRLEDVDG